MPEIESVIKKQYGDGIITSANSIINRKRMIIPVSPAVDIALSGGFMEGTHNVICGKPKAGKTSLGLFFIANCQKEEYGAREAYIYNIESRIKKRDLECVPGLDLSKTFIIESTADKILNCADYLQIAHQLISTKPKSVHLFDSLSFLSTESELNDDMDKGSYDNGNKLIAKFCRKISAILPITGSIVISINHLGINMSGYGNPWAEKSSTAVKYHCEGKLICRSFTFIKYPTTSDNIIGQQINWVCEHSPCGPPGKSAEGYLIYGKSISREMELLNIAKDLNLIEQSGSWLTFSFLLDTIGEGVPKIQGTESARTFLVDNPEYTEILNKKVREMLGLPL